MNEYPLVSVIIPTYNRADKLGVAIESVIAQTYPAWEIVIIDDDSHDDTKAAVAAYISKHVAIKYIKLDRNSGPAYARNVGIRSSKGEYIAFLSSDDTWYPEHLEKHIAAMLEYHVKVSYSFWTAKTMDGGTVGLFEKGMLLRNNFDKAVAESYITINDNIAFLKAPFFIEYAIINDVYCYHIDTLVISREVVRENGDFDATLRTAEDDNFSFRLMLRYDAVVVMESLHLYHQGTDNLYNFIERQTVDIKNVSKEADSVRKFTKCLVNNYNSHVKKKKIYLSHGKFSRKKEFIGLCNKNLRELSFAVAYLNKEINRRLALRFILKSIIYGCRAISWRLLLNISSNGYFFKNSDYNPYINLF